MRRSCFLGVLFICWLGALTYLEVRSWRYETARAATLPVRGAWPVGTSLTPGQARPTVIMAAHPQCPCTRASLTELSAMARETGGAADVKVLFYRPPGVPAGWERTDLWSKAQLIPGLQTIVDEGGREMRRFGLSTSGEVKLFGPRGQLLFHGGITESRGHEGENPGLDSLEAAVQTGKAPQASTPVFGCGIIALEETAKRAQPPKGENYGTRHSR